MEISKEMKNALDDLFLLYQKHRILIPTADMPETDLVRNDDYKKCFLINILIKNIMTDEIFYTVAESLLEENKYDINLLFSNFSLDYDENLKTFKLIKSDVVE